MPNMLFNIVVNCISSVIANVENPASEVATSTQHQPNFNDQPDFYTATANVETSAIERFYQPQEPRKELLPIGVPKLGKFFILSSKQPHLLDFADGHNIPMTVTLHADNAEASFDRTLPDVDDPCPLHDLPESPLMAMSTATGNMPVTYATKDWYGHIATIANTYGQPILFAIDRPLKAIRVYWQCRTYINPSKPEHQQPMICGFFDAIVLPGNSVSSAIWSYKPGLSTKTQLAVKPMSPILAPLICLQPCHPHVLTSRLIGTN